MTQTMTAWVEIPVTDLEASVAYYDEVFGWKSTIRTDMGPNPIANLNDGMDAGGAHLYPGMAGAGTGSTTHLAISGTIEAAAKRVAKAGGQVVGPVVDIPPGRFQYTLDLDGNSIGLFEPKVA
ncbi:VOC family protein [Octadecabacter sp.]|nr:VOC family protein [Octadecabacter sp.]